MEELLKTIKGLVNGIREDGISIHYEEASDAT